MLIIGVIQLTCEAIPVQFWTGPEGSRRLRLPEFLTIGKGRWQGCHPSTMATFTSQEVYLVCTYV